MTFGGFGSVSLIAFCNGFVTARQFIVSYCTANEILTHLVGYDQFYWLIWFLKTKCLQNLSLRLRIVSTHHIPIKYNDGKLFN